MARQGEQSPGAVPGVVRWFSVDEGWGVIDAPEVPGGCFVHFSNIEAAGYRSLSAGQRVRFSYEDPGFAQDGTATRTGRYRCGRDNGALAGRRVGDLRQEQRLTG